LTERAAAVLKVLGSRGASFLSEIARSTGAPPREVEDALWELTGAGLVTADAFDNLRTLIDPARRARERRWRSGRARQLAGRWVLLESAAAEAAFDAREADRADARSGHVESFARQLLLRWGVVLRDLLARETLAPPWRELLRALRRLEARGEIRGGRFVAGFMGEQFARPEAVELLRSVRRGPPLRRPLQVAAADPLNLAGIVTPGPRVSALAATRVDVVAPSPQEATA
jgi:ATP-dependent Lhr-like helicase